MKKRSRKRVLRRLWDEVAGVRHVSETSFPSLVVEAETQQELIRMVHRLVPGLYAANRHSMNGEFRKDIPIQATARHLETIRLATPVRSGTFRQENTR